MYGLRHKYIRIEDQQLILKMNIIFKGTEIKSNKTQVFLEKKIFDYILFTKKKSTPNLLFYKLINDLVNYAYSGL